jgi:hypothetical protein
VRGTVHKPIAFQTIDRVGDTRRVDLESIADLAEWKLTFSREVEQGEDLEPAEVESQWGQCGIDAADQNLVCTGNRRSRSHGVDRRPFLAGPIRGRFRDRVEVEGHVR